jgi:hypothetical protein
MSSSDLFGQLEIVEFAHRRPQVEFGRVSHGQASEMICFSDTACFRPTSSTEQHDYCTWCHSPSPAFQGIRHWSSTEHLHVQWSWWVATWCLSIASPRSHPELQSSQLPALPGQATILQYSPAYLCCIHAMIQYPLGAGVDWCGANVSSMRLREQDDVPLASFVRWHCRARRSHATQFHRHSHARAHAQEEAYASKRAI